MTTRGTVLAIVSGVALAAIAGVLAPRAPSPTRSSFNPDPLGSKLLYRWLERVGRPVSRLTRPLEGLGRGSPEDTPRGVLVVVAPLEQPSSRLEAGALLRWVGDGNGLVYFSTLGAPWAALPGASPEAALLGALGFPEDAPDAEPWAELATLARPNWSASTALERALPTALLGPEERAAGGTLVARDIPVGPWLPLLRSPSDVVQAWTRDLGGGRVTVFLEPGLVENRRLAEAANAAFLLRLLDDHRRGGAVLFEETLHGHVDRTDAPWAAAEARRTFAAKVALVALVYIVARGRRLGPAQAPAAPPGRAAVELAEAMGSLYRRAGARRAVVATLWRNAQHDAHGRPEVQRGLERLAPRVRALESARRVRDADLVALERDLAEEVRP